MGAGIPPEALAEAMDGTAEITSTPEAGTVVTVRLPRA